MPKGYANLDRPVVFTIHDITLPEASFGCCINWAKCKNTKVDLGNGLCVFCWDKRAEKLANMGRPFFEI